MAERVVIEHNGERITLEVPDGTSDAQIQQYLGEPRGPTKPMATSLGQDLGRKAASVGDTVSNIATGVLDFAAYFPARAYYGATMSDQKAASERARKETTSPKDWIGRTTGVAGTPEYENEPIRSGLRTVSEAVAPTVDSALGTVSEFTGIPRDDVNWLAEAASMAVAPGAARAVNKTSGAVYQGTKDIAKGIDVARIGEYSGRPSAYQPIKPEVFQQLSPRDQQIVKRQGKMIETEGMGAQAFGETLYKNVAETFTNPLKHIPRLAIQGIPAIMSGGTSLPFTLVGEAALKTIRDRSLNNKFKAIEGSQGEIVKTPTGAVGSATNRGTGMSGTATIDPNTNQITPVKPSVSKTSDAPSTSAVNPLDKSVSTIPVQPVKDNWNYHINKITEQGIDTKAAESSAVKARANEIVKDLQNQGFAITNEVRKSAAAAAQSELNSFKAAQSAKRAQLDKEVFESSPAGIADKKATELGELFDKDIKGAVSNVQSVQNKRRARELVDKNPNNTVEEIYAMVKSEKPPVSNTSSSTSGKSPEEILAMIRARRGGENNVNQPNPVDTPTVAVKPTTIDDQAKQASDEFFDNTIKKIHEEYGMNPDGTPIVDNSPIKTTGINALGNINKNLNSVEKAKQALAKSEANKTSEQRAKEQAERDSAINEQTERSESSKEMRLPTKTAKEALQGAITKKDGKILFDKSLFDENSIAKGGKALDDANVPDFAGMSIAEARKAVETAYKNQEQAIIKTARKQKTKVKSEESAYDKVEQVLKETTETVKNGKDKLGNFELRTYVTPKEWTKTPFDEITSYDMRKQYSNDKNTFILDGYDKNGSKYRVISNLDKNTGINKIKLYKYYNDGKISQYPIKTKEISQKELSKANK
jgi:hypothetical protein